MKKTTPSIDAIILFARRRGLDPLVEDLDFARHSLEGDSVDPGDRDNALKDLARLTRIYTETRGLATSRLQPTEPWDEALELLAIATKFARGSSSKERAPRRKG